VASSPVDSSYLGGKSLSVTGAGFSANPADNLVYVCGEPAKVTASTTTTLTVTIPALPTQQAVEKYKFVKEGPVVGKPIGNEADASAPFDGQDSSFYYSTAAACYVGLDLGMGKAGRINTIKYYPEVSADLTKILGGVFEGSNDGTTFTLIGTVPSSVHSGYNTMILSAAVQYRFLRLRSMNVGGCAYSELQFVGVAINTASGTLATTSCPL
jgi:hypothetical protein